MLPRVDEEDPIEMDNITFDNNVKINGVDNQLGGIGSPGGGDTTLSDIISAPPAPTLSMVTKHQNGSLNLWQLTFGDKSKFSQVSELQRDFLEYFMAPVCLFGGDVIDPCPGIEHWTCVSS